MTVAFRWGAATHEGEVRDQNEDAYVAQEGLFLVADGMGGHLAGEVAADLAVAALRDHLGEITDIDDVVALVRRANEHILRESRADHTRQGMGTTLTGLVLIQPVSTPSDGDEGHPVLGVINVGDSRTYRLRHGELRRLTVDHSYVQELVTDGLITSDEARFHPRRNIVTRALGIEDPLDVDGWTLPVVRGDRFLICSDGLVDEVPEPEIRDVVTGVSDPQQAAEQLVQMALRHGGRDNVTVVVVDVTEGMDPAADHDELVAEMGEEPHWAPGAPDPTWSDDTGETEPPAISDEAVSPAAAVTEVGEARDPAAVDTGTDDTGTGDDADAPPPDKRRRRGRLGAFLFWLLVVAILAGAFVIVAAYARSGYFVDFTDDDQVMIYKGRPGGVLWFDPTEANPTTVRRANLDEASVFLVEGRRTFSSLDAAAEFVTGLSTTTTTTTTTPPTTVAPTTTLPGTTVPSAQPPTVTTEG